MSPAIDLCQRLPKDGAIIRVYDPQAMDKAKAILPPSDHVICYCGSGVTACHNLLAMEHAGLGGAKLYVGSWSEWSADPSRPVERG